MQNASLIVLCVLLLAPAVETQAPTFSTRREVVRVDVLVSAGGRPVTGLTPDDFEVRDNGVLQTIDLARLESMPLNVVLAFDLSRSVAASFVIVATLCFLFVAMGSTMVPRELLMR